MKRASSRCLCIVDLDDGVSVICGLQSGHSGRHGFGPDDGRRCNVSGCVRAKDHRGRHVSMVGAISEEEAPF